MQTNPGRSGHVIVIGGGIAGAAAAHRLHRNGFQVTVLEAQPRVGGRTSTIHQDGFTIDLAASILLNNYKRTVELIAEQQWENYFTPASDTIGVERDGRIYHIRASKPLGAVTTGLLSARAKAHLAIVAKDVLTHRKQLDWQNPVAAAGVNYGTVKQYADTRVRNAELRDHLIDPACRFLGLSSLQEQSAVDFLFLARNMGKTDLFNSPDGIDILVRLLVSEAKVETDAQVTSVDENNTGVTITWSRNGESQIVTADACVLAIPAPLATQVYPQMGTDRAAILNSIVYTPALNVYLGLETPTADPAALILIPEVDYPDLACVIVDHNKTNGRTPPGKGLISTFWQKQWALEHWNDTDEQIVKIAMTNIERLLPDATGPLVCSHVQRWERALVTGPPTRYRDLERFKALTPQHSRVQLAGDSMSSSTINSCLCSGERAADELSAALAHR